MDMAALLKYINVLDIMRTNIYVKVESRHKFKHTDA